MHIPDNVLGGHESLVYGAAAGALAAAALVRAARSKARPDAALALTTAAVFALQRVNFAVPWGTSGHLLGAALLSSVAAPELALLAMGAVLAAQCFALGDGGASALGANFLNIAALPTLLAAATRAKAGASPRRRAAGAALGAWLGCVAGALACALELAASGRAPWAHACAWMGGLHALVGLAEAALTACVVWLASRPTPQPALHPLRSPARLGLALALGAALLVPLSSRRPDALEALLAQSAR